VLPLAAGTDHTATWATMFNLTDLTAHQTNALKGLDPATMFNMRDGGGALSDLAHGASQGNGARSAIVPRRSLVDNLHLVRGFLPPSSGRTADRAESVPRAYDRPGWSYHALLR
jgi:hypothetical protein